MTFANTTFAKSRRIAELEALITAAQDCISETRFNGAYDTSDEWLAVLDACYAVTGIDEIGSEIARLQEVRAENEAEWAA